MNKLLLRVLTPVLTLSLAGIVSSSAQADPSGPLGEGRSWQEPLSCSDLYDVVSYVDKDAKDVQDRVKVKFRARDGEEIDAAAARGECVNSAEDDSHSPEVYIGGGSGIFVRDAHARKVSRLCTLSYVGNMQDFGLVGVTSKRCAPLKSRITAERWPERGFIGESVYVSPVLDLALIKFTNSNVVPVKTVGLATMFGHGDPNRKFFSEVITTGARTYGRHTVYVLHLNDKDLSVYWFKSRPQDWGAPIVSRGSRWVGFVTRTELGFSKAIDANAALADIKKNIGKDITPLR